MTQANNQKDDKTPQRPSDTAFSVDPLSDKIGASLKSMYEEVVKEPVPDAFLSLLAKADAAQRQDGDQ
jgi:hypothetical protein